MSLSINRVSFAYGQGRGYAVSALSEVTLEVGQGELVLVVGETGSGKSTLLRMAAGLLNADEGEASIDGEPLTLDSARGRVGLIFQDPESQLFADTLVEDVAFGPRNLGLSPDDARRAASRALDSVGLCPEVYGERSPFSLSGGEARRAAIAGVLAMRPEYLLADEPTAGLDAHGRRGIRALLAEQKAHSGIVVVSHVAEEFLALADRVLILAGGKVAWTGSASEAIGDPSVFSANGLKAPDVLELQLRVTTAGRPVGAYTLDPVEAARRIAGGGA